MESTKLEMEFIDESNKKFVISIEDPREDINPVEVEEAMNDILAYDIFKSGTVGLKEAKDARVIITTINKLEF